MDWQVLLNSFLVKQIRHFLSWGCGVLVGMDVMQQIDVQGVVEINSKVLAYMVLQFIALLWSYVAGRIKLKQS